LLGIVENGVVEIIGENNRSGINRAGETTTSRFITSGFLTTGNIASW
jgi:hypothetical protein